jgi:hypothetical protein
VLRRFVEQCCPKTGYYSKSTYAFSEESVGRVTERWQPFVTRFGYDPRALERSAA